MKSNILKRVILVFTFALVLSVGAFSEDQKGGDKYTTVNLMLRRIYSASEGVILEYFAGGRIRQTYLPNSFFEKGLAVRVFEDNDRLTPQANIVYKNGKEHKVKIYLPKNPQGFSYRVLEYITTSQKKGFKTNKLVFKLSD